MGALLKRNIPNILSGTRAVLSFALIFLALNGASPLFMLKIAIVCGLLDLADGWFARKFDAESDFGAFLDRLADKIFICPIIVILAWRYWPSLEPWEIFMPITKGLVVFAVFLEIVLMTSGLVGLFRKMNINSNKWGKRKMVVQSVAVCVWFLMAFVSSGVRGESAIILHVLYFIVNLLLIASVALAVKSLEGYWEKW
jgi:CDP-diacylglycerol--glycerol-3-phosphate 3-phosphatidyltransferase